MYIALKAKFQGVCSLGKAILGNSSETFETKQLHLPPTLPNKKGTIKAGEKCPTITATC